MPWLAAAMVGSRLDQDVAGLHLVAFLHQDLGDRAAALVLHLLDVAADHQRPVPDHGAGEIDHRGEPADTEDQGGDGEQADHDVPADAGADVRPVIDVGLARAEGGLSSRS